MTQEERDTMDGLDLAVRMGRSFSATESRLAMQLLHSFAARAQAESERGEALELKVEQLTAWLDDARFEVRAWNNAVTRAEDAAEAVGGDADELIGNACARIRAHVIVSLAANRPTTQ